MTAHCRVSTDMPVSWLIAGSRMLTADVFALTTSVERQVAASTPPVLAVVGVGVVIGGLAGRWSRTFS